ncbi:hypothetical protein [Ferrovibrio xuzhouensis]|uniref:Uncharacterized protein n=1 Tax=Ferrovibrio xuzhouensis TaxID=1576914 RepID=A0ABV7VA31_9PROT
MTNESPLAAPAGLATGEIDGARPCYCVDPGRLQRLQHLIGDL